MKQLNRDSDVIYTFRKEEPKPVSKLKDIFVWEYGNSYIPVKEDIHNEGSMVGKNFTTKINSGVYKGKELTFHVAEKKYTDSKGTVYRVVLKRK